MVTWNLEALEERIQRLHDEAGDDIERLADMGEDEDEDFVRLALEIAEKQNLVIRLQAIADQLRGGP